MKPGPEMDALVAQKIMSTPEVRVCFVDEVDVKGGVIKVGTRFSWPPYSTSIEAAWEVVEKWKELEPNCLYTIQWRPKTNEWFAGFLPGHGEWPIGFVPPTTAPHAICLAALKAVGVEV